MSSAQGIDVAADIPQVRVCVTTRTMRQEKRHAIALEAVKCSKVPRWRLHATGANAEPDWTRSDMDDVTERWLPAVGWEGFYEVSDRGNVRSRRRKGTRGGIIKSHPGRAGHMQVGLYALETGRPERHEYVHRLVAEAFIGPCPDGEEVRHLDGNPANNLLENLAYGTHARNMHDVISHGTSFWAQRTHCVNNHEFTLANTRIAYRADGSFKRRCCRACENDASKRKNRKRKAARQEGP